MLLILAIILIVSICPCYSQSDNSKVPNFAPVSPNVNSLLRVMDYPVSHFTGIPNISIPIYEIKVDDYVLPITLNYHSSGFKVEEEASWVGLGWSLSAGGCVSRAVKCYDDFAEKLNTSTRFKSGYYQNQGKYQMNASEVISSGGLNQERYQIHDTEPDIFRVSTPEGSNKFIFNFKNNSESNVAFFKTDFFAKVDVIKSVNNGAGYHHFEITSPSGNKYVFQDKEVTQSESSSGNIDYPGEFSVTSKFISTWQLSKITTKNGREIKFQYETEIINSIPQQHSEKYNRYSGDFGKFPDAPVNGHIENNVSKSTTESKRLSKIIWDAGVIEFKVSEREDLSENCKKLDKIIIYDSFMNEKKSISFNYDYFNNHITKKGELYKRLKLLSVTNDFDVSDSYRMEYNEPNNITMPKKNSLSRDIWGYYNGKEYESNNIAHVYYDGTLYKGNDRLPSFNHASIGLLSAIRFPTGNITTLDYEMNVYKTSTSKLPRSVNIITKPQMKYLVVFRQNIYDDEDFYDYKPFLTDSIVILNQNTQVNIEIIGEHLDFNFNDIVTSEKTFRIYKKNFEYEIDLQVNGKQSSSATRSLTLNPGVYYIDVNSQAKDYLVKVWVTWDNLVHNTDDNNNNDNGSNSGIYKGGGLRIKSITDIDKKREFIYSDGTLIVNPTFGYKSIVSGYNEDDNGGIGYHCNYIMQLSNSAIPLNSFSSDNSIGYREVTEKVYAGDDLMETVYTHAVSSETATSVPAPFQTPIPAFDNGLLLNVSYKKNGQTVKREMYEYEDTSNHNAPSCILAGSKLYSNTLEILYFYKKWYNLTIDKTDTSTDYYYNNHKHFQLQEISTDINDNTSTSTVYYYPTDLKDEISLKMQEINDISTPIETLSLNNNKVIRAEKIVFKDTLGVVLPIEIYEMESDMPKSRLEYKNYYKSKLRYVYEENYKKPVQLSYKGVNTTYLWSYKGLHPVAKIINCTYAEIENILSKSFINQLCKSAEPTEKDYTLINSLNNYFLNSQISIFRFDPIIGVNRTISVNGVNTDFIYNRSGQLVKIKDMNGFTLTEYEYKYILK